MHPTSRLHPDFGPSYGDLPVPYGIPITIVAGTHAKHPVSFTYASESDKVKYPLGSGHQDRGRCRGVGRPARDRRGQVHLPGLRDVRDPVHLGRLEGRLRGDVVLTNNALRPAGWTSADAAGLPILPGLLRLDEVKAGLVDHAIRFTTDVTDDSYVWPARHAAGSVSSAAYPPMGARFRLKASYSTAGLRADTKVVIKAMKQYGLVLADNGSSWYFQGTSEAGWPSGLLDQLKQIPASAFEAVDTSSMKVSANSAAVG